jgi:hypothetical protein
MTGVAQAQETTNENQDKVMYLDSEGNSTISSNNGNLSIMLNGSRFEIGNGKIEHIEEASIKKPQRAYFGFMGLDSPSFNHIAWFEIGTNAFVNTDYSMYSPEDANALMFSSKKAVHLTMNVGTLNVPLNKSRSLVLSTAFGFTCENYTFAGDYTMEFKDGMMRPVALDGKIKKSKLEASYFHVPIALDWNINGSDFFISAGVTLDVLMNTRLKYKFPKTFVDGEVTLNPIQVGATARIGWKRLYAFANYSFIDMFKAGTGPKARRLSAGMGIWF